MIGTIDPVDDPHDLRRFVEAQEPIYAQALNEIRSGRKRSHWIWFIFPQMAGLGVSEMSEYYGIKSVDEARAYLAHPVLGARLRECADAALAVEGKSAEEIFGWPGRYEAAIERDIVRAGSGGGVGISEIAGEVFRGERR